MSLHTYLDSLVDRFERPSFIDQDPISVPHAFDDPRDQEAIALFAALLAWGRRQTVLDKMAELCERMQYRPHRFLYDFSSGKSDRQLEGFRHRTFQPQDAYWLSLSLSAVLRRYGSLEDLWAERLDPGEPHVGPAIEHFSSTLLSIVPGMPHRTAKHLARPSTGSACKRLCMFLRWMVRGGQVDLGLWQRIQPDQLVLPLDVHSGRSARALGLLDRRTNDWRAAMALTTACRQFDAEDPCRYDYAFFGTGVRKVPLDPRYVVRPEMLEIS